MIDFRSRRATNVAFTWMPKKDHDPCLYDSLQSLARTMLVVDLHECLSGAAFCTNILRCLNLNALDSVVY